MSIKLDQIRRFIAEATSRPDIPPWDPAASFQDNLNRRRGLGHLFTYNRQEGFKFGAGNEITSSWI
jgi:hypothetical protein